MVYTAEEKLRMDYLFEVFRDVIRDSKQFDIAYTDKAGYFITDLYKGKAQSIRQIEGYDDLFLELVFQISETVRNLNLVGYHDDIDLFPEEIALVRHCMEGILNAMTQDREYCLAKLDYYLEHVND